MSKNRGGVKRDQRQTMAEAGLRLAAMLAMVTATVPLLLDVVSRKLSSREATALGRILVSVAIIKTCRLPGNTPMAGVAQEEVESGA